MADSTKTNCREQESEAPVQPEGRDDNSDSGTEETRFDTLKNELLLRARKRAEAASSSPVPYNAADDYVPASPTRIGQPAFRETDEELSDDNERHEVEQADTLPSFPAAADSDSEQTETAAASADETESNSRTVVMRAEVVVVDVNDQAEKEERKGPDRRESRRVLLRECAARSVSDEASGHDGLTRRAQTDFLQSEIIAFDEFTADGPIFTPTDDPKSQQTSLASNIPEDIPSMSGIGNAADAPGMDYEPKPNAYKPSRPKKRTSAVLAVAALASITIAGLFILTRGEKPSVEEQPTQESGAQATNPLSTTTEVPMTQVTSSPEGAELIHQGAVIGNTPTKVKTPTYEQIYLLRLPGYESQLLRVSPASGETVHVTLQPSGNRQNDKP